MERWGLAFPMEKEIGGRLVVATNFQQPASVTVTITLSFNYTLE